MRVLVATDGSEPAVIGCELARDVTSRLGGLIRFVAVLPPSPELVGGPWPGPTALDPKIVDPAEKLLAKYYPGVPLVPFMSTGATDGVFLEQIGIPVYGPPGLYGDPDGNGTHGLNEHEAVKAVYTGRDYLFDLIKAYAG